MSDTTIKATPEKTTGAGTADPKNGQAKYTIDPTASWRHPVVVNNGTQSPAAPVENTNPHDPTSPEFQRLTNTGAMAYGNHGKSFSNKQFLGLNETNQSAYESASREGKEIHHDGDDPAPGLFSLKLAKTKPVFPPHHGHHRRNLMPFSAVMPRQQLGPVQADTTTFDVVQAAQGPANYVELPKQQAPAQQQTMLASTQQQQQQRYVLASSPLPPTFS